MKDHNPGFTLITIKGEQWTFASANADTITKLLSIFLDGLRRRSRWAIAIQDFIVQGKVGRCGLEVKAGAGRHTGLHRARYSGRRHVIS